MRYLFVILCSLFPVVGYVQPLKLEYGVNKVDINADGVDDMIVRTRWENFNAHSFDRYVIAVALKGSMYEIPLGTSANYRIQTDEGAECLRTGYKFRLDSTKMLEVIRYSLQQGVKTYCESSRVAETTYRLKPSEGDIGLPYFFLNQEKEVLLPKLYETVEGFLRK